MKQIYYGVKALTLEGGNIPVPLQQIPDAPKTLFYRGVDLENVLSSPRIAIVGSRKVDQYGTYVTKLLSRELAESGCVIISGLALGVDALAHQACIEARGKTIAVLPCGIDTLYPKTNERLGIRIASSGGLISEHDGTYMPHEHDFLIRNRLVSGLAQAVIVTEAAARSGSLNTARHALEQGKIVMAVPGPITNPLCEGPNNLIKMGATPVTCCDDVLQALQIVAPNTTLKDHALLAENEGELRIITLLKSGTSDGELLRAASKLNAQEFNVHLTMLEIRGIIAPLGGNTWILK